MQGERGLPLPGVRAAFVRREVLLGKETPRRRMRDAQARISFCSIGYIQAFSRTYVSLILYCSQGSSDRLQDEGPIQQTGVSNLSWSCDSRFCYHGPSSPISTYSTSTAKIVTSGRMPECAAWRQSTLASCPSGC